MSDFLAWHDKKYHKVRLRSYCQACERIQARIRGGWRPTRGQPYGRQRQEACDRGHPLKGDNVYVSPSGQRRCRECHRVAQRAPAYREWCRFYMDAKRRERGVPRRAPRLAKAPQAGDEAIVLPAEPFVRWLRVHQPDGPLEEWARSLDCNETALRRHLAGDYETVRIDFADRVLMAAGAHLSDAYPYDEGNA